jgi:flagellar basal-body rod protein FlgC
MTISKPSVYAVLEDQRPQRMEYQPNSPLADAQGYVALPNVNVVEEMTDMMSASRLYQANVTALQESRSMGSEARKILTQA